MGAGRTTRCWPRKPSGMPVRVEALVDECAGLESGAGVDEEARERAGGLGGIRSCRFFRIGSIVEQTETA